MRHQMSKWKRWAYFSPIAITRLFPGMAVVVVMRLISLRNRRRENSMISWSRFDCSVDELFVLRLYALRSVVWRIWFASMRTWSNVSGWYLLFDDVSAEAEVVGCSGWIVVTAEGNADSNQDRNPFIPKSFVWWILRDDDEYGRNASVNWSGNVVKMANSDSAHHDIVIRAIDFAPSGYGLGQ